jgi:type IV pilus assembly protein PilW
MGFTLIELLVSMVLLGLVTLASVSLYTVAQQSYKSIDTSQELQDSARFAFNVIGQAVNNAGYQEFMPRGSDGQGVTLGNNIFYIAPVCSGNPLQSIVGFNSSAMTTAQVNDMCDFGGHGRTGSVNNSDSLAVMFFGSNAFAATPTADNTTVDCLGSSVGFPTGLPTSGDYAGLGLSMFYVAMLNGEPTLYCLRAKQTGPAGREIQPLVRGVESFQVMYGVAAVGSSVPTQWVSAQDVSNWRQVRAVRVGLVIRGPVGSASAGSPVLYPLGQAFIGTATEAGVSFPAASDGRNRRAFTSVFMLRNPV